MRLLPRRRPCHPSRAKIYLAQLWHNSLLNEVRVMFIIAIETRETWNHSKDYAGE